MRVWRIENVKALKPAAHQGQSMQPVYCHGCNQEVLQLCDVDDIINAVLLIVICSGSRLVACCVMVEACTVPMVMQKQNTRTVLRTSWPGDNVCCLDCANARVHLQLLFS